MKSYEGTHNLLVVVLVVVVEVVVSNGVDVVVARRRMEYMAMFCAHIYMSYPAILFNVKNDLMLACPDLLLHFQFNCQ